MLDISVIVPAFNEDESIPELASWIEKVMRENNFSYEVLFIDDGSTDNTWEVIEQIHSKNNDIKGIKFQRNYGKSAALNTGFQAAKGEVVITMDADLQDSPDEIPELYKMIKSDGYDLVSGWKKKRYDPISKTIPSKFFNFVTSIMSGIRLHDFNCGLKAYNYKLVKSIEVYGEMHRYIPVIAKRSGFKKITEKVVIHRERKYGVSKFGLERFIFGFLDLMSITFVSRFKKKPMHFFGSLGTIFSFFAIASFLKLSWNIIYSKWIIQEKIQRELTDQPLFFVTLTLLIIGIQLFLAGFVGEMVSLNDPNRNDYLIEKKL